MRPVEFYIILTDGMCADPDGGLDHHDPAEDGTGRQRPDQDAGEIVMGRGMYDVMEYWDARPGDPAVSDVERGMPRRGGQPPNVLAWPAALRASGDRGDAVEAEAAQAGEGPPIGLGGGAELPPRSARPA
jgi:dihydrofolate reductase